MTSLSDQLAERYKPTKESEIQKAVIQWASHYKIFSMVIGDYLIAIPNGGSRHIAEAVNLKAQGVKPGVSDLFLALPKGMYHGLWIELKRDKACKPTKEQLEWQDRMREVDYQALICYSVDEAIKAIEDYLAG